MNSSAATSGVMGAGEVLKTKRIPFPVEACGRKVIAVRYSVNAHIYSPSSIAKIVARCSEEEAHVVRFTRRLAQLAARAEKEHRRECDLLIQCSNTCEPPCVEPEVRPDLAVAFERGPLIRINGNARAKELVQQQVRDLAF